MPNSQRFRDLRRRLTELRQNLLPKAFSPTGTYSTRQMDRARGYRLLAHAEIEAFIEGISREAVTKKIGDWVNHRNPSDLLVCFLASYHAGWVPEGEEELLGSPLPTTTRPAIKDAVNEAVDVAMTQYIKIIKDNHGIREKNLKKLILPVGVRITDLDATWVTNMDEFGKQRGEVAHTNIGAQQAIDPRTELNTVTTLLEGLKLLDELILALAK
jgi:hypothetical protein